MIEILVTIVLIAVVMIAIVKKFHPTTVIFSVSIIALVLYTLISGVSVVGEKTTGNLFLDVFELLSSTTQTQIAGNCLICMVFLGYIQMIDIQVIFLCRDFFYNTTTQYTIIYRTLYVIENLAIK